MTSEQTSVDPEFHTVNQEAIDELSGLASSVVKEWKKQAHPSGSEVLHVKIPVTHHENNKSTVEIHHPGYSEKPHVFSRHTVLEEVLSRSVDSVKGKERRLPVVRRGQGGKFSIKFASPEDGAQWLHHYADMVQERITHRTPEYLQEMAVSALAKNWEAEDRSAG